MCVFLVRQCNFLIGISSISFRRPGDIEILVGTNDLNSGGQRYKVQKVIQHERYNQPSFANDIGLVRIDGRIKFNEKVQPIKYSNKFVDGGAELQTTGWGRLNASILFDATATRN